MFCLAGAGFFFLTFKEEISPDKSSIPRPSFISGRANRDKTIKSWKMEPNDFFDHNNLILLDTNLE